MPALFHRYAKPGKDSTSRTRTFIYNNYTGSTMGRQTSHSHDASHYPRARLSQGHQIPIPSTRLTHTRKAIRHQGKQGYVNKRMRKQPSWPRPTLPTPKGVHRPGEATLETLPRCHIKPPSMPYPRMQRTAIANTVRCDRECSAVQSRMQRSAIVNAARCIKKGICYTSEKGGGK